MANSVASEIDREPRAIRGMARAPVMLLCLRSVAGGEDLLLRTAHRSRRSIFPLVRLMSEGLFLWALE